jgi:outer membrane protein assembly factor BamB
MPSDEIVEIDFNNGVEQRLKYGEHFKKYLHHDIKKVNGNYHAITYDTAIVDLSSIGGSANQEVIGDGIIVLSENGELLWEWSVFDVRSPLTDPAILKRTHDWLHMNSLTIDADGNYYLSFRNTSEIWKVDGSTGDLLYSYTDDVLSGQHSMELINQEQLILFNNSLETNQSSALIYKISQGQISNLMYQTPLDQSYFSYVMGSAYLNDNNLLFCSTSSSSILLTDFNGNIEWKYEDGFFPFRAYSFKPKEFNFTRYYE